MPMPTGQKVGPRGVRVKNPALLEPLKERLESLASTLRYAEHDTRVERTFQSEAMPGTAGPVSDESIPTGAP